MQQELTAPCFAINGVRDTGSKDINITANVYVHRKSQQFQKNFKCRRENRHLEERYPAFFGKVLFLGCNFHIYYIISSSTLHVSSIYTRVLNRKYYWIPPQCPELTCEWFIVRCALVTSVCGLTQWRLVLPSLNYTTINGLGSHIWLHAPRPPVSTGTRPLPDWALVSSPCPFGHRPVAFIDACAWVLFPLINFCSSFPSLCLHVILSKRTSLQFCTPDCTFTISRI